MENSGYLLLEQYACQDTGAAEYVALHMKKFLKPHEQVLVCLPVPEFGNLGQVFEAAIRQVGARPIRWNEDRRWKTLLRQCFAARATAIVAPPRVVLGLSKLAKATCTPLNIRNVITVGYPCLDWMIDGFMKGLDCQSWGCFAPGGLVTGFSCGRSLGVHLRQGGWKTEIVDESGNVLPVGQQGRICLYRPENPAQRCVLHELARLEDASCGCGGDDLRLMDMAPGNNEDPMLLELDAQLQAWTSILDCRLAKGPYGLEMELVVFRGEKLPKLPTCAKRVIRSWDPERDTPMDLMTNLKTHQPTH